MEEAGEISREELRELIIEQLDEIGIAPGTVDITVLNESKVLVEGNVDSERGREYIIRAVRDVVGKKNVVDELMVTGNEYGEHGNDAPHKAHGLYDEDNEYVGSEDVFRAVEDGVPYIPPTDPSFMEYSDERPGRIRRKKRRHERS
jgi:hypothetical protein